MEHWRNSTGKRRPKCSEETLSQCELIYLKFQKNRPETHPAPRLPISVLHKGHM